MSTQNPQNNGKKHKNKKHFKKPWHKKKPFITESGSGSHDANKKPVNNNQETREPGRPCEYETRVKPRLADVEYWAEIGLTNEEMADNLGIAESTFYDYQNKFQEFSEAICKKKPLANIKVVKAAHRRACGYSFWEEEEELTPVRDKLGQIVYDDNGKPWMTMQPVKRKKKHVPADTNAAKFWLINRDKKNWRDKTEVKSENKNDNTNKIVDFTKFTNEELDQFIQGLDEIISDK